MAGNFRVEVDHDLGQAGAIERIQGLVSDCMERFSGNVTDVNEAWEGCANTFSFKAFGNTISGTLSVMDDRIVLVAQLPLAAMFIQHKIRSVIQQQARLRLAA
ncbi:MAG: polyhydroxyalkanoic acid system family protein [Candidatus Uhrbacteria bacterium]